MKKIFIVLITLLVIVSFKVEGIVTQTNNFYVNDYADILSEETEDYIMEKSVPLYEEKGAQIVVVTIKSLEGRDLEGYANELFNSWGIGNSKTDAGLLILISKEDRLFRVEVGDGLEGILPDGKVGRIEDKYMIPYLKINQWDMAIKEGYNAFYTEITNPGAIEISAPTNNTNEGSHVFYIICQIIIGIFVGIGFIALASKKKVIATLSVFIYFIITGIISGIFGRILIDFNYKINLFGLSEKILEPFFFNGLAALVLFLLIVYPELFSSGGYSSGGRSYGGHSSGGRSSGGGSSHYSGGGGHSSGGGASRGF